MWLVKIANSMIDMDRLVGMKYSQQENEFYNVNIYLDGQMDPLQLTDLHKEDVDYIYSKLEDMVEKRNNDHKGRF